MYITICKIDSENLLYDAGSSNQVLHDKLEEWDVVESGRQVQEWIYVNHYG